MSEDELRDLWDRLRRDGDVPYDFPVKCCYARAHRIADTTGAAGFDYEKICVRPRPPRRSIQPRDRNGNRVRFPPGTGPEVEWSYHVTVVVTVRRADGTLVDMVLDPALGDGPMTVDDWLDRMGGGADVIDTRHRGDVYVRQLPCSDGTSGDVVADPSGEAGRRDVREKLRRDRAERDAALHGRLEPPGRELRYCCIRPRRLVVTAGEAAAVLTGTVVSGGRDLRGPFRLPLDPPEGVAFVADQLRQGRLLVLALDPETRSVWTTYGPSLLRPQAVRRTDDGLQILTIEPSPFVLRPDHPRFATLSRRLRRAARQGADVWFVTPPGDPTVLDALVVRGSRPLQQAQAPAPG